MRKGPRKLERSLNASFIHFPSCGAGETAPDQESRSCKSNPPWLLIPRIAVRSSPWKVSHFQRAFGSQPCCINLGCFALSGSGSGSGSVTAETRLTLHLRSHSVLPLMFKIPETLLCESENCSLKAVLKFIQPN